MKQQQFVLSANSTLLIISDLESSSPASLAAIWVSVTRHKLHTEEAISSAKSIFCGTSQMLLGLRCSLACPKPPVLPPALRRGRSGVLPWTSLWVSSSPPALLPEASLLRHLQSLGLPIRELVQGSCDVKKPPCERVLVPRSCLDSNACLFTSC